MQSRSRSRLARPTDAYDEVIASAEAALTQPLESVTFQGPVFASPNWFYTTREAPLNVNRGDYFAAIRLGDKTRDLGLAYAFTGDAKYADICVMRRRRAIV